jgi:hypothetical protein
MKMILLRNFASTLAIAVALGTAPAFAADNDGHDPSADQYAVCSAILESCMAACSLEPPSDAVLDPNAICEEQCRKAYQQCMKGLLRTGISQSKRLSLSPLSLGMGGTPKPGKGNGGPADEAKPPVDSGNSDDNGDTGFDPGSVFGGGNLVFSPN